MSSKNGKLSKLNSLPKSEISNFGGSTLNVSRDGFSDRWNPSSADVACALFSFWPAGLGFCDLYSGFSNTLMSDLDEKHVVSETIPLSIESSRPTGLGF